MQMWTFLRKNRDFSLFLATQAVSNLGDSLRTVTVPLIVLQLTGSALHVSAMALLETLAYFLFNLPFGAILDHAERRRAMLLADIGRGALMLAIPALWLAGEPVLISLYVVTALMSILSSIFSAGSNAVIPKLVGDGDLSKAYALFEAAESGAWIVGPLVAGVFASSVGLVGALVLDAATFLISAAGLLLIKTPVSDVHPRVSSIWASVLDGLRVVTGIAALRRIQLYWSLYGIIGYGTVTGLIYVGSRGGTAALFPASLSVSAYALGSVIGTLFAGQPRTTRPRIAIPLSLLMFSIGSVLIASTVTIAVPCGALLIGASEGFFLVVYLARRAQATPVLFMARIGSIAALLARLASGISVAWMGLILDRWQGPGAFGMMAVLSLLLAGAVAIGDRKPRSAMEAME
jgi:hypothetical protein